MSFAQKMHIKFRKIVTTRPNVHWPNVQIFFFHARGADDFHQHKLDAADICAKRTKYSNFKVYSLRFKGYNRMNYVAFVCLHVVLVRLMFQKSTIQCTWCSPQLSTAFAFSTLDPPLQLLQNYGHAIGVRCLVVPSRFDHFLWRLQHHSHANISTPDK